MVNCFNSAEAVVGKLNEQFMPVDVATTMDLIRKIWLLRYAVLHEPTSPRTIRAVSDVVAESSNELAEIYRQMLMGSASVSHYASIQSLMATELKTMLPVAGEDNGD
jgi:hypothetical protein